MFKKCDNCSESQHADNRMWAHAQVFARRQTLWDTAMSLLRSSSSSDSSLLGTFINLVCIAVV